MEFGNIDQCCTKNSSVTVLLKDTVISSCWSDLCFTWIDSIDESFCPIGPVELAAAGVSIALFNQASRITIFPLVSITTSFVAEEDTVAKMNVESAKVEKREKNSDMLDDMEKGASKPKGDDTPQNGRHLGKFSPQNSGMEEASTDDIERGEAGKGAAEAKSENSDEGLAKNTDSKKVISENVKPAIAENGAAKNSVQLEGGTLSLS